MKILIVYNICGLSGKDNSDYYIEAINSIREQTYTDYKLVVSSCGTPDNILSKIKNVDIIHKINTPYPVNITFNEAVNSSINIYGEFDYYLYLDSGVKFTSNTQLAELMEYTNEPDYSMITAQVDYDFGWCWFGYPPNHYSPTPFIVPVGKACNLHCQLFSNELRLSYGRILPDIFRSYCTESVFSFLNAAIDRLWVITHVKVHHQVSDPNGDPNESDGLDGHSYGFRAPHGTWDDTIYSDRTMKEICSDPLGTLVGFGYEELRFIKVHDPNKYLNEKARDDRLKLFLKDNMYIKEKLYPRIEKEIICLQ